MKMTKFCLNKMEKSLFTEMKSLFTGQERIDFQINCFRDQDAPRSVKITISTAQCSIRNLIFHTIIVLLQDQRIKSKEIVFKWLWTINICFYKVGLAKPHFSLKHFFPNSYRVGPSGCGPSACLWFCLWVSETIWLWEVTWQILSWAVKM